MIDWKAKLADKFPRLTRRQLFYLLIIIGIILIFVFVPMSLQQGDFFCDKGAMKMKAVKK